ncbi:hypothetical protein SANTM175S_07544 [Streptomyces antimycoticus]
MTHPTGRPDAAAPATALRAPAPGWATEADVVVVGSGVAGLTVALRVPRPGPRSPWSPRPAWTTAPRARPRAA